MHIIHTGNLNNAAVSTIIHQVLKMLNQGSNLEPLLFIMFMNDSPKCVENADIKAYGDNTMLVLTELEVHTRKYLF